MVQQHMESFRQKQMKLDELTQPAWGDMANYFCERDKKYGTTKLQVPAVINPQMNDVAAAPARTTFEEQHESVDIVPGKSQIPQGTFQPGSHHRRIS